MTAEEARAVEYRRKMTARARNKAAAERALAGSAAARAALDAKTVPLSMIDDDGVPRSDAHLR